MSKVDEQIQLELLSVDPEDVPAIMAEVIEELASYIGGDKALLPRAEAALTILKAEW